MDFLTKLIAVLVITSAVSLGVSALVSAAANGADADEATGCAVQPQAKAGDVCPPGGLASQSASAPADGACCPQAGAPSCCPTATAPAEVPASGPATQPAKLPTLVDLGAHSCIPCKQMMPILDELRTELAGRLRVQFIDVSDQKNVSTARFYNIKLIPTQIYLDADGNELWRHEGFLAKADLLEQWKQLGYDFEAAPASAASQPAATTR